MKRSLAGLVAAAAFAAAAQTFTGVITDDMCERGDHTRMQMGPTDRECTLACVDAHGAAFVLFDGKTVYKLSDQKLPENFAGQKVRVTGTLDPKTRTIQVQSISAAK
jgi:hypothetical protein